MGLEIIDFFRKFQEELEVSISELLISRGLRTAGASGIEVVLSYPYQILYSSTGSSLFLAHNLSRRVIGVLGAWIIGGTWIWGIDFLVGDVT